MRNLTKGFRSIKLIFIQFSFASKKSPTYLREKSSECAVCCEIFYFNISVQTNIKILHIACKDAHSPSQ